jgi:hypothetical protein
MSKPPFTAHPVVRLEVPTVQQLQALTGVVTRGLASGETNESETR